jgi:hypothetical protein
MPLKSMLELLTAVITTSRVFGNVAAPIHNRPCNRGCDSLLLFGCEKTFEIGLQRHRIPLLGLGNFTSRSSKAVTRNRAIHQADSFEHVEVFIGCAIKFTGA